MEKLVLMSAYEMVKEVKSYLEKSPFEYKVRDENAADDYIEIFWESQGGKDGLPYLGGSSYHIAAGDLGHYRLFFDFGVNEIFFAYYPAGENGEYTTARAMVNVDDQGNPVFRNIENKILIVSLEKEWNDKFETYGLTLQHFVKTCRYSIHRLSWAFLRSWNFNEGDNAAIFKDEFVNKIMKTCQSPEMASFIKNKLFPLMDSDRKL